MKMWLVILATIVAVVGFDAAVITLSRKQVHEPPPPEQLVLAEVTGTNVPSEATEEGRVSEAPVSEADIQGQAGEEVENAPPPAGIPGSKLGPDAIQNEYILSFFDSNDQRSFIDLARSQGVRILDQMAFESSVRVHATGRDLDRVLMKSPIPTDLSPNYFARVPEAFRPIPNLPEGIYKPFGTQALSWLGAPSDIGKWGSGISVAVLDTGIQKHPAFAEDKMVRKSFLVKDTPGRLAYHGTAVASLIAGKSDKVAGVAPAASILDLQVLGNDGSGDVFTLAKAIVEAVNRRARIINLSVGTHSDSYLLKRAVELAADKRVVLVAAVGNDSKKGVLYPARYEGVVAVSAVDAGGKLLFFSNWGAEVALAAPGFGVKAAGADGGVIDFSGTSAAVPFVSGALAALMSIHPDMTAPEAVALLRAYADDSGQPGRDILLGDGIMNIGRTVNRDVRGIHDVAVCSPYAHSWKSRDDDVVTTLYVQNRGTEPLAHVWMKVQVDAVTQTVDFHDLAVGKTAGHDVRVPPAQIRLAGSVVVACEAGIDGKDDVNPANNSTRSMLSLKSDPKSKSPPKR